VDAPKKVEENYSLPSPLRVSIKTRRPSEQSPLLAPFFLGFPCPCPRRRHEMEVAPAAAQQKTKKPIHLFYCSECEELALKIAASSDAIELQSINWR